MVGPEGNRRQEKDHGGSLQVKVRQMLSRFDGPKVLMTILGGEAPEVRQDEINLRVRAHDFQAAAN